MSKTFFHYYTMDMHRKCMEPVFDELKRRGWRECAAGQERDIAFVPSADLVKPEYKEQSPIAWIPHGLSPAKWAFPRELGGKGAVLPDLLLLPGPMYVSRITSALPSACLPFDISWELVGWGKSDELFDGSLEPAAVQERPMILFAPSWNYPSNESVGTYSLREGVEQALRPLGGTLVIAPHSVYHREADQGIVRQPNINNWLLAADVVVTDQSSIGIEAACIDKPVVHLLELWKQRGWSSKDGENYIAGHMATLDTLAECVSDALANPNRYRFLRQYWAQASLVYPGEGAVHSADAIEKWVEIWAES